MAKFNIRFIGADGKTQEEVREAPDRASLYTDIMQKGGTLVSAEEIVAKERKGLHIEIFKPRVKLHDKIIFIKNLSAMLEAGLAVSRALSVIERQTKNKYFKSVVMNLNKSISRGTTLADSMREYPNVFTPLMTSMVKAGEESGSLANSLKIVGSQLENAYKLTKKIRGALMYPAIIVIAMIGIGFFMLTYIVPTLSATFKELNAELPLSTRVVIGLSDFLKENIIISVIFIVAAILGLYFASRTKQGKRAIDYGVLHIPVIGQMIIEVNAARTARTLSSLLTSGVDVVVATRITGEVLQNSYYKDVMAVVEQKIQKGEQVASIFEAHQHLYPPFVGEMIAVGEETGQLSQMLLGVAVFYETEVDQKTKDMSSIIEPFLMVFIGLAVGFFAISMIGPIYSLGDSIG